MKLWIGMLMGLSFSVYGQGVFGEFEGTYRITKSSIGKYDDYALLSLKEGGDVIFQTYPSGNLVWDCLGRGEWDDGLINVDLVCSANGETFPHQFVVDIDSSIGFYDFHFDPDGFLTLVRTVASDGSIDSRQQYFQRITTTP